MSNPIQVYVLQDTELMKFVFDLDPTSTQKRLPDFKAALETALRPQPLRFNLYDTEFYSQVDGSLDFGRTRCVLEKKCPTWSRISF